MLALDDLAFAPFWRLGALGLRDALDATPVRQFRATRSDTEPTLTGYAITGRAGDQGYLQRIAVHPETRRAAASVTRSSPTRCTGSGVKG